MIAFKSFAIYLLAACFLTKIGCGTLSKNRSKTTTVAEDSSTMAPQLPPTSPENGDTSKELSLYPKFPFPPPRASAFKVIPRSYFSGNEVTSLSKVLYNRLIPALDASGYEYSFYSIKDSGIAVVTRLEKMNDDGTSVQGMDRYATNKNWATSFTLADYLKSLFVAKPGYYRLIVFTLCPYSITQANNTLTKSKADSLFAAGADRPEDNIMNYSFSKRYECTALIYQFIKPNQVDTAREFDPSTLTCQQHLDKSGIWPKLLNLNK